MMNKVTLAVQVIPIFSNFHSFFYQRHMHCGIYSSWWVQIDDFPMAVSDYAYAYANQATHASFLQF